MLQMCQCHNSTISSFFSQIDHKQRPRACTSACTQTQKAHICAADEQVCDHECIFPLSFSLCRPNVLEKPWLEKNVDGCQAGSQRTFSRKTLGFRNTNEEGRGASIESRTQCSLSETPADKNWLINLNILKTTIPFLFIGTVIYRFFYPSFETA